jgi:nicotinamidase-related amidase
VNDGEYLSYDREIDPATTALILVDVWAVDQHANRDLMQRIDTNVRSSLLALLKAVRADGRMLIVHYPNRRKIHPAVRARSGEVVANTGEEALAALRSRRVTTLIYAGYAGNMCLANRPLGVLSAYLLHGFRNIIVVRDASLSIEPPQWENQGLAHQGAMLFLEMNDYAATTTVADVEQALR